MRIITLFLLSSLFFHSLSFCAATENSKDKKGSIFAIPAATYTSDIGFGMGAGVIKTYYTSGKQVSNLQGFGLYTTKKQFTINLLWSHFFREDRYRFYVSTGYELFPSSFFGIGNANDSGDSENFTPEKTELNMYLERIVYRHLKLRSGLFLCNQSLQKYEDGGMLETIDVPWKNGRFDAGPIIGLVWDSRDNTMASREGLFVNLSYAGIFLQDDGNAYNKLKFDLRYFVPAGETFVFASQIYFEETAGDVPFYLLPSLGSQDKLRGYELDRYRDKSIILLQQDMRFDIWGPVGGVVFAGCGRAAEKRNSLFSGKWHTGAGTGLRYFIDREDNLVLRTDFAWGADAFRFYATFSEAF